MNRTSDNTVSLVPDGRRTACSVDDILRSVTVTQAVVDAVRSRGEIGPARESRCGMPTGTETGSSSPRLVPVDALMEPG